jgi:hypothetical protein
VLGVDLGHFFHDEPQQSVVARRKARVLSSMSTDACEIHFLLPKAMGRLMDPVLVILDGGARTEEDSSHEGEEFGFVLRGPSPCGWMKSTPVVQRRLFLFQSSWDHCGNSGSQTARICGW